MAKLGKIVYLSEEQLATLIQNGSITSGGQTITYSANDIYVTPQTVTKEDVGLGNVDNTADADKPISTATQTALNAKANSADLAAVATSGAYSDLTGKPTIPAAVTESTVSGWGFTKNTGTYSKPSGGIPKTDLASAVQTSLGKADTALQEHQDISGKANTADLAAVATSGSYNDLTNKPTIPSAYSLPTASSSTKGGIKIGNNLSMDGDMLNATNTTYNEVTTSLAGLMTAPDKVKLNNIESGAQVNTLIGVKGDAESSYRIGNVNISKANLGLGNVENKDAATILAELTGAMVISALGFTPTNATTIGASSITVTSIDEEDYVATIATPDNIGSITAVRFTIPAGSSVNVTLGNGFRGKLTTVGYGTALSSEYIIWSGSSGSVNWSEVQAGSNITLTKTTGVVNIANSHSSYIATVAIEVYSDTVPTITAVS